MTSGLVARIKSRLEALGIAEREASRRAGIGVGYVGDLVGGRIKNPTLPKLSKLADALECDVNWLMGTQESVSSSSAERRSFGANAASTGQGQRLINLYSSPSVSNSRWVPMSDGAVDRVPAIPPLAHVDNAYAWSISTRRMEPRYFVAETVYLHPGVAPRIGDFVLAKRKDGLSTVARLDDIGDTVTLSFLADNEQESVPAEDIEFIHRIVGSAG